MKHYFGWFLKGFALFTVLAILAFAINSVNPGLAQSIINPNADGGGSSSSVTEGTDNPAGIVAQPMGSEETLQNNQNQSDGQGTYGMTDDLYGRNQTPLEQADIPVANNTETGNTSVTLAINMEGASLDPSSPLSVDSTSPLVIPGADFRSDGFDPSSIWFSFWGGYEQGGNVNSCMMAPAYLPNGATVYDIYASVVDNIATASLWIDLYRVDNYLGSVDVMAQMWTDTAYASSSIISLEDYPIDFPLVEYPTYSYYVGACLESVSTKLYSVRLWFY
jgi:hypothetical protein